MMLKLIIIEDDLNFGKLIARALEGLAEPVHQVDNWQAAFEHIASEKDDAAWVDLRMPGASEEESILNITKLREMNRQIIIVVGSGFVSPYVRAQLDHAGIDGVFYKTAGFRAEQIASLIVLGMMRARMRNDKFNDKLLTKALEWMGERYPNVVVP